MKKKPDPRFAARISTEQSARLEAALRVLRDDDDHIHAFVRSVAPDVKPRPVSLDRERAANLRAALADIVDATLPCDIDRTWCHAHRTYRCDMDAIMARARAALAEKGVM